MKKISLFSHTRKPRSNYRRPSSLGLSQNALNAKSEAKLQFKALPSSRSHIVPKGRTSVTHLRVTSGLLDITDSAVHIFLRLVRWPPAPMGSHKAPA